MDLSIIISVAGKPGLYKVVGRSKNGLIAESLTDSKRIPVRTSDKVSALSDISIFTTTDDVPLVDVFVKMWKHFEEKETPASDHSPEWMSETLRAIVPDYDESRVYNSDLKKLYKWYNLLVTAGLIDDQTEGEEATSEESAQKEEATETKAPEKKAKSKAKKKKED
ncbi:MAG: hypothetical protein EA392_15125 [Cryomorphaceae bacterium]|nr:MAG: hypothetical protein EA392_15125 [Cryomorphaceae bacterium]